MKKWKLWTALVIALLLFAGAFVLTYIWWLADPAAAPRELQTAPVERRALTQTVKAAGAVAVPDPVVLSFPGSGHVVAVHTREGQSVRAGQPLVELRTDELELGVEAAEAALGVAQARLLQAQQGPRAAELSAAQSALAAAQSRYDEAAAGPLVADIAAAEADLKSAQVAYNQLISGPNADELRVLRAELEKAQVALRQAQGNYDRFAWREGFGASPEAAALEAATIDHERALGAYNLATAPPTEDRIERAKAAIVEAQARIERLRAGSGAAVEAAAADISRAQAELDRLNNLPEPQAIAVAEAQVRQAEVAVRQAKERLNGAILVAPQDGVVLELGAAVGEVVSPGAAVVKLIDLGEPQIVVRVHETYIGRLALGQQAEVRLDASPLTPYHAEVVDIAPLSRGGALAAYDVTLDVDAPGSALRPGMSAEAEIVTAAEEACLVVPRGALRLLDGRWTVQVVRGGAGVVTPVTVGLVHGRDVEVLEGIDEGEQVVLQSLAVAVSTLR